MGHFRRQINYYCVAGRIPGAVKMATLWLIPKDAKKPMDMRTKAREGFENMNSVLIIDDDKELCALMMKCVEQENLSAVVAHGGLEGLRLLGENKDTCCLIILDVMMPVGRLSGIAENPGEK